MSIYLYIGTKNRLCKNVKGDTQNFEISRLADSRYCDVIIIIINDLNSCIVER